MKKNHKSRKSQISIEYVIIVGFASFVLIMVLGLALVFSGAIKDRIKLIQVNNFANKILSTSESVFFYGEPSKATISAYLPDGVINITLLGNTLFIETQTSTGIEKYGFAGKVPITGDITTTSGIKRLEFIAEETRVSINRVPA